MRDQDFLEVIDSTPLVSIDLIVENQHNQILLGKRTNRPAQGFWFVPGGRIRKNETLAQAFHRISSNELGNALSINDATYLGAYDHIYTDNFAGVDGVNTHYVALGYKVRIGEDFLVRTDSQHSDVRWWTLADLLSDDTVHGNTKLYFSSKR